MILLCSDVLLVEDESRKHAANHDLNERIAGPSSDTALVLLVATHPDVSLIAPRFAPRILDDVVLLAA